MSWTNGEDDVLAVNCHSQILLSIMMFGGDHSTCFYKIFINLNPPFWFVNKKKLSTKIKKNTKKSKIFWKIIYFILSGTHDSGVGTQIWVTLHVKSVDPLSKSRFSEEITWCVLHWVVSPGHTILTVSVIVLQTQISTWMNL